jgi:hypothetical protein
MIDLSQLQYYSPNDRFVLLATAIKETLGNIENVATSLYTLERTVEDLRNELNELKGSSDKTTPALDTVVIPIDTSPVAPIPEAAAEEPKRTRKRQ